MSKLNLSRQNSLFANEMQKLKVFIAFEPTQFIWAVAMTYLMNGDESTVTIAKLETKPTTRIMRKLKQQAKARLKGNK